jgi:hypothetical protein
MQEAGLAEIPGRRRSTSLRSERRLRPVAVREGTCDWPGEPGAHLCALLFASLPKNDTHTIGMLAPPRPLMLTRIKSVQRARESAAAQQLARRRLFVHQVEQRDRDLPHELARLRGPRIGLDVGDDQVGGKRLRLLHREADE